MGPAPYAAADLVGAGSRGEVEDRRPRGWGGGRRAPRVRRAWPGEGAGLRSVKPRPSGAAGRLARARLSLPDACAGPKAARAQVAPFRARLRRRGADLCAVGEPGYAKRAQVAALGRRLTVVGCRVGAIRRPGGRTGKAVDAPTWGIGSRGTAARTSKRVAGTRRAGDCRSRKADREPAGADLPRASRRLRITGRQVERVWSRGETENWPQRTQRAQRIGAGIGL